MLARYKGFTPTSYIFVTLVFSWRYEIWVNTHGGVKAVGLPGLIFLMWIPGVLSLIWQRKTQFKPLREADHKARSYLLAFSIPFTLAPLTGLLSLPL